jgi:cyclic pyranopterin phosphate synthase
MGCFDPYGRKIAYVRLSLTDKCNLRCFYCLPERHRSFEPPEHYLTFDEIERVITAFANLGVSKVRLTGGEPLVRKGVTGLAQRLAAVDGIEDLSLSTNAMLLAELAGELYDAGVKRLNISLDSLRSERFAKITRGGDLEEVLAGLTAAKTTGFSPIKINMLVMKDVNDDEVMPMAEYAIANGFALRFIETMPVGAGGRQAYDHYLNLDIVRRQLMENFDLIPSLMPGGGPARYLKVRGTDIYFGFITPLSQHFCDTCNRVRLAVDGTLHLCLGDSHTYPLRPLLRAGCNDQELEEAIIEALAMKPMAHSFELEPDKVDRVMSATGG